MSDDTLDVRGAAALLGVSIPTLRRWDKSGRLRASRHPTRKVRVYDRAAVLRLRAILRGEPAEREGEGFYGRAREVERLVRSSSRIVAVIGPGGIGKTTLAKRALDELRARGKTATFCDAAHATDEAELLASIASSVGIEAPAAASHVARVAHVARFLARAPRTLVVDNVEQCAGAATKLLRALDSPNLRWLVTSRVKLGVGDVLALETLDEPSAVRILVHQALRNGAGIDPSDPALRSIARRLDGIPLALELAGAHLGFLAPSDLDRHLAQHLDVLVRRRGAGPERHRTMRAAVEWSVRLLDPGERSVLAQLAVFEGGFDLDAAQAVVESSSPTETVLALESLHDKSLLQKAGSRFSLFDVVREVVRSDGGSIDRHAKHFARVASVATLPPPLVDPTRLRADRANLAAAHGVLIDRDPVGALAVALSLEHAEESNARIDMLAARIESSLASRKSIPANLLALGGAALGRLRIEQGRQPEAIASLRAALADARRSKSDDLVQYVLALEAIARILSGDAERASKLLDRARTGASSPLARMTQAHFGSVAHETGRLEEAERRFSSVEDSARASGDVTLATRMRARRARVAIDRGDLVRAEAWIESAVETLSAAHDRFEAQALAHRALLRRDQGRFAEARADYARAAQLFGDRGAVPFEALYRALLGAACADLGREDEAASALEAARQLAGGLRDPILQAGIDCASAHLDRLRGDRARARRKLESARRHADRDKDIRASVVRLERLLERDDLPTEPVLVVSGDGAWFLPPRGETIARPAAASGRVLLALAKGATSSEALLRAGWPGERIVTRAASHRLHQAISELRALGAGDITRVPNGYRLRVPVRVEPDHP